jgi:hypothetical protein
MPSCQFHPSDSSVSLNVNLRQPIVVAHHERQLFPWAALLWQPHKWRAPVCPFDHPTDNAQVCPALQVRDIHCSCEGHCPKLPKRAPPAVEQSWLAVYSVGSIARPDSEDNILE